MLKYLQQVNFSLPVCPSVHPITTSILVQGSENLCLKEQIIDFFLKEPVSPPADGRRLVIVFHCEFSSKRGPSMSVFLINYCFGDGRQYFL